MLGPWIWKRAALIIMLAALGSGGSATSRAQGAAELGALHTQVKKLYEEGKYADALMIARRSLALAEKLYGPDHQDVAASLDDTASLYDKQGRYADAEPLYKRSLAIREKAWGPDHPDVGSSLDNLGMLYYRQGRYSAAEALIKRSLANREKARGLNHRDFAQSLNNLALLYATQGRYFEAEPIYKRSLAIWEKALGPDHPEVSASLHNIAGLYWSQGRYAEAEPLDQRGLAIREKALGPDHPDVGQSLNSLAEVYRAQGRNAEAEPLYKRSLAIWEKALGPDHPNVALPLSNLGALYQDQGRFEDAERFYTRCLAIRQKSLGPSHPDLAQSLFNLAVLYKVQRRYVESEALYKRSLAIREKALGPRHSSVGNSLNALAAMYDEQGRRAEAEPLFKRAISISETAFGADHPDVAASLNNLAVLYAKSGRYAKAEPLYKRALAITENALGPDHGLVALALSNLATLSAIQRNWGRTAEYLRRSSDILARRMQRSNPDFGQAAMGAGGAEAEQTEFRDLVKVVYRFASEAHATDAGSSREMFETAQWARGSQAAASLAQMAVRVAKGKPALAAIVRERQDLVSEWQMRDQGRTAAVAQSPDKRDRASEDANAAQLAAIDARLEEIDKRLIAEFPEYASLSQPQPLSVGDVQSLLGADEVLILFLDTPETMTVEETFIWVVTKTGMRWVRSELGTPSLAREVAALRCGLDYQGSWASKDSRCAVLLNATYSASDDQADKPLPFSPARAHALYRTLLGEVEDLIEGKHLLVVPSGALTQLPFQVLVTANPQAPTLDKIDFRKVAWLVRSHAITVLPAVSSLRALRQHANAKQATRPFLGVGNPLLDGPDSGYAALRQASLQKQSCAGLKKVQVADKRARGGVEPFAQRGGIARVTDLRLAAPLPETADELCDVAKAVGAAEGDVLLGVRASEGEIKRLSESGTLRSYRIVHFATHGALAGEFSGSAEPGLLLTPPSQGTEADDGYLSASEIAGLKFDAEWVILSACNTAAGNARAAAPLSGLARAFFYAGARSLLVSHWYVDSVATVSVIKGAFAELKGDPKMGRSEALRRSMMVLIEKGSTAQAHPAVWAPFVIVGEGRADR